MGERQTPPLVAVSVPGDKSSGHDLSAGIGQQRLQWPPQGWPMFSCVVHDTGMAFRTTATRSDDDFLKYEVSCDAKGIYQLEILSGTIGRDGTKLTPMIGMRLAAREDWFDENPGKAVLDIHIRGQNIIPERGAVLRVILAMTFIISRIDRGIAPNIKRVLKTYRLN